MPGLVGGIGNRVNPDLIAAMRCAITHRDWYQTEDYVSSDGRIAISRVNLGAINKGKQPYEYCNGRVKIFLHGEIYYDKDIALDLPEYIYRLYEKHKLGFASFLNGSFIIVILDDNEQVALIANDRIASKPLYLFRDDHALYFSPEIKGLLPVSTLKRKICLAAVADFLANGQFTTTHTLIEEIETLDSATVLVVKRGVTTQYKYWKFEIEQDIQDKGLEHYHEALDGLLSRVVRRYVQVDNRYAVLLSGGYDSRGILGYCLKEKKNHDINTVSWGREEDIPNSDCVIAKRLACKLGTHHGFYQLSAQKIIEDFRKSILLGEGLSDFPESYDLFDQIRERQKIDIVLRGDHCWGFSRWATVHDELSMFRTLDLRSLQYMGEYQRVLKPHYHKLFCELEVATKAHISSRCDARNIFNRYHFFYLDVRMKHYLNPLNYVKNFALESIRPLLDNDLLDFVQTVPLRHRRGKKLWQTFVVKMFPELMEEIATKDNMIDWAWSLKSLPEVERFVYRELLEDQYAFDEYINKEGLKRSLDAFFSSDVYLSPLETIKSGITHSLYASPNLYRFAHKLSYYAKTWSGKIQHDVPAERLVLRLLILKTWGDVFLNYPVAKVSA